jgi:16S rRNA G966 N2-methylase RsmD
LQSRVRAQDAFEFLKRWPAAEKFDIVFADPPYEKSKAGGAFTEKLLTNEDLVQLVEPGGVFVLEKRPDENLPEPKLWEIIRRKKYGATEVLFLRHSAAAAP